MSAQEIHTLAQQFVDAFNNKNLKAALDMLSDDLEVFDHVPYRFDNKKQFMDFVTGAMASFKSMQFGFRQLSCRLINEGAAVANAYDTFVGVMNDGKAQMLHGRTTLVLAKEAGQWKIVSAHFSPLPTTHN